jgi:hypothetical protein
MRRVAYVDVAPAGVGPPDVLRAGVRAGPGDAARLDAVLAEVERIAREELHDLGAETCGAVAAAAKDERVASAALAVVEAALARGHGGGTYGSLLVVAADRERTQEVRMRAVDALARFALGRLSGRFEAGPRVHVVSHLAVPPRVREHVRERLGALAGDADGLVAERARAALAR